ncbi:MAG: winged helix-turn-helix domain-containing protein [Halobaculum sp.]
MTATDSFADEAILTRLFGDDPKVKIVSVLLAEGRDIDATRIAELGGMGRSTVYQHIDSLLELDVVEQTREVGGSPLYQLNRDSEVAQKLGELEWALLDELAEDGEPAGEFTHPDEAN